MSDQSNNWREELGGLDFLEYEDSFFESEHAGPTLSNFGAELDSLAQKAFDGEYGTAPFDPSTEGHKELLHDAYEQVGAHMPEEYWFSDDGLPGGAILDSIHVKCDWLAEEADVVSNDFAASAFAMEKEDAVANANPPELQSRDKTVLDADAPQILVDAIVAGNEGRAERGETLITLQPETIAELESRGVDVSGLVGASDNCGQEANNKVDTTEVPVSQLMGPDNAQNSVGVEIQPDAADNTNNDHASIDDVARFTANGENVFVTIERDAAGEPKDIISIDENGNETRLSDILADLSSSDLRIEDIFGRTLEMANHGEDWQDYLKTALNDYIEELQAPKDIIAEETDSEKAEISDDSEDGYRERYDYHNQALVDRKAEGGGFSRDAFAAYHEMAKTYNAYKAGIEIDGRVPNAADVYVAYSKFVNSNIFETILIDALRAAVEKPDKNDVDKEKADKVSEPLATDSFGIPESGRVEISIDDKTAKDISSFRKELPEAAKAYGADMTKVDRGSRDDLTIRTTNPDSINGRGISITLDSAKRFIVPDLRLVDFKGDRLLVDPFGKVMDVVSGSNKFSVGQTISGLDISSTEKGKVAIETYARDKGISINQAKTDISSECQARFCERIEASYKVEAHAIERTVIPREQETKADIESKIANLGRMEQMATAPDTKAAITERRIELQGAKDAIDGRISALKDRVDQLHNLADKGVARSLSDRFSDAIASEKGAIGRSVTTVDFGVDMKAASSEVKVGIEDIKAKVEAHNADKPEMDHISYDSKTGNFVDRFGINDKGEYVGNTNGKFMGEGVTGPETAEQKAEYIKEHYDPSRFAHVDKMLTSKVDRSENKDIEKSNVDKDSTDANKDPVEKHNDPTETIKDPAEATKDPTEAAKDLTEVKNDSTEKKEELGNNDKVDSPNESNSVDQEGNKIDPTEKPGEANDTEKNQAKESSVENPNEDVNNDAAEQSVANDTDGGQDSPDVSAQNIEPNNENSIGGDDIEALADETESNAEKVDNERADSTENQENKIDNEPLNEYNEFGEGGNVEADTELKDPAETTQEESGDDDVEDILSDVSANAEGIDAVTEKISAIDGIDAPASTAGTEIESNSVAETAPETTAVDGGLSAQGIEVVDIPPEASASDASVSEWCDEFGKALADLDPTAGKDAVSDFITAHSDSLAETLKGIDDPTEKEAAISEMAHSILNSINDWLESASPEQAEQCVEIGADFMEGMLGPLDMETAMDVADALRDAQNDVAFEVNYDQIDAITDGLDSGLEPYMTEYYELDDGLVIAPDGTTDASTGDEVGGFSTDAAASQFESDVANDIMDDLKNISLDEDLGFDIDRDNNDQSTNNQNTDYYQDVEMDEDNFDQVINEASDQSVVDSSFETMGEDIEAILSTIA